LISVNVFDWVLVSCNSDYLHRRSFPELHDSRSPLCPTVRRVRLVPDSQSACLLFSLNLQSHLGFVPFSLTIWVHPPGCAASSNTPPVTFPQLPRWNASANAAPLPQSSPLPILISH
jgi:hypothetical protein